jgi:serine/threonine protein kinase
MDDHAGNVPDYTDQDVPPLHVGTVLDGKYKLVEFIGIGGMGSVYRARHLDLGNDVAIKFLHPRFAADPAAVKRFQREARIISGLRNNNILSVFAFGNFEGHVYMSMEYIQGKSLRALIAENGPLTPAQAIPLLTQICDAMTHAHANDVLHRDLKPDNALAVTEADGKQVVKVVDFGLAKLLDGTEGQRLTATGDVLGDPNYMSPEQCQGKELDARSDIYSMGCLMYEIFTGEPPFLSDSPVATMYKHLADAPPAFAQKQKLPEAIEAITMRALAKTPEQRYDSFAELKDQLQDFSAHPEKKVKAPGNTARQRSAISAKSALAIVAVTTCAVGIAAVAWSYWNGRMGSERELLREQLTENLKAIDPDLPGPYQYPSDAKVGEALRISEKLGDETANLTARLAQAKMCSFNGQMSFGIRVAEDALKRPDLTNKRRAQFTELLGKMYFYNGNYAACDRVLTPLLNDSSLFTMLESGRDNFAYVLVAARVRSGKSAEAEKVVPFMRHRAMPSVSAINLEALALGELLCHQKNFVKAEKVMNRTLTDTLNDLSTATILESFARWFSDNGDLARARSVHERMAALASANGSLYLRQRAAATGLYVTAHSNSRAELLKDSQALFEQVKKPPVTLSVLGDVAKIYQQALKADGRVDEARKVKSEVESIAEGL